MKTIKFRMFKQISSWVMVGILVISSINTNAQTDEYDDLYFSSSDRKTAKVEPIEETPTVASSKSYNDTENYNYSSDSYSAKTVNPEYIARYKSQAAENASSQISGGDTYSSDDYYVEGQSEDYAEYDAEYQKDSKTKVINNYYGYPTRSRLYRPYSSYDPFYYDPFYDPFFYGPTFGSSYYGFYSPYYRPRYRPGLTFSVSYGYGYGGYYCPSPYYPSSAYYAGYNRGYYNGSSSGYYVASESTVKRRSVVRGPRSTRTSVTGTNITTGENNLNRRSRVIETQSSSSLDATNSRFRQTRVSENRDYTTTQNQYLRRSRGNVTKSGESEIRDFNNISRTRTSQTSATKTRTRNAESYQLSRARSATSIHEGNELRRNYNHSVDRTSGTKIRGRSTRRNSSFSIAQPSRKAYKVSTPSRSSSSRSYSSGTNRRSSRSISIGSGGSKSISKSTKTPSRSRRGN